MANFTLEELEKLNIYELRYLARNCRVASPSSMKKKQLIKAILDYNGVDVSLSNSKVGRPSKPFLLTDELIKQKGFNISASMPTGSNIVFRSAITPIDSSATLFSGYLAQSQAGYCLIDFENPLGVEMVASVSLFLVKKYNLEPGDYCVLERKPLENAISPSETIISINGSNPSFERLPYNALIPNFEKKSLVKLNGGELTVNCGDKVLYYYGNYVDILNLAGTLSENPNCETVLLLLNATPSNVHIAQSLNNVKLFFALFSDSIEKQNYIYNLALEYSKKMVVLGKNIAFVVSTLPDLESFKDGIVQSDEPLMIKDLLSTAIATDAGSFTIFGLIDKGGEQIVSSLKDFFEVIKN